MKIFKKTLWAVCFSVSLFSFGCAGASSTRVSEGESTGTMQDFELQDLKGQNTKLFSVLAQNKAVLVNFWATWCPPCREELPGLIDMQTKYKDRGFTVLGVDVGESQGKVQSFADDVGINYPVLLDRDQSVTESYGITGIPTSYLVDPAGKILGTYHSYDERLVADVEKALNID